MIAHRGRIILDLERTAIRCMASRKGGSSTVTTTGYCYCPSTCFCRTPPAGRKARSSCDGTAQRARSKGGARPLHKSFASGHPCAFLLRADSRLRAREGPDGLVRANGVRLPVDWPRTSGSSPTQEPILMSRRVEPTTRPGWSVPASRSSCWTTRRTWSLQRRIVAKGDGRRESQSPPRFVV